VPHLESNPKLLALLAPHVKHGTVAAGIQPDIPFPIDCEPMMAREVMQPASIHLEFGGSGSQRCYHWTDIQKAHDEFFHGDLLEAMIRHARVS
jgi:hypothetical protein